MGDVHNEWTSRPQSPPKRAAPTAPTAPARMSHSSAVYGDADAPGTTIEPRLLLLIGLVVALLLLFVLVVTGRDSVSKTACTVNGYIVESDMDGVTVSPTPDDVQVAACAEASAAADGLPARPAA